MTDLGPYTENDFIQKKDYFDDLNKTEGMLKALSDQITEHDRRIAELERKINLLADRVLHYYNHTTPEIEELKKRIEDLEQGMERLGPIIGHKGF